MGDCQNEDLRVGFDRRLKLKFLVLRQVLILGYSRFSF